MLKPKQKKIEAVSAPKPKSRRRRRSRNQSLGLQVRARSTVPNNGQYSYQDGIDEEDPVKERNVVHTVEYNVGNIATPLEMSNGQGDAAVEKGVATYFVPPTAETLGTFIGKKSASSTFYNDSDQPITVMGAWCKNWSEEADVIDSIEPFKIEIPPMSSKKVTAKKEWNWPLMSEVTGTGARPAMYLMMRYFVKSSDAWSSKYKATDLAYTDGKPVLTEEVKSVTAYRRVDNISYYTIGGKSDDEASTGILAYGSFLEFKDVQEINGTQPYPPLPYKMQELKGRIAGTKKTISFFGVPMNGYRTLAETTYQDVKVDFTGSDYVGLGTYPVDWYDDEYGWGSMNLLVCPTQDDLDNDTVPEPWQNTYTTPDLSSNTTTEWEIPVFSSLIYDEYNDKSVWAGGRYRLFDEARGFVQWDYIRNKPSLAGWGYDSFSNYKFYGPRVFSPQKTMVRCVLKSGFRAEGKAAVLPKINFGAIFSVVSSIVEVMYILTQAIGKYMDRELKMQKLFSPAKYHLAQKKNQEKGLALYANFRQKQEEAFGDLRRKK